MHAEVLPLLNNEKGFRQDMTLLGGNNGMSISVWDDRACAETYNTKTYQVIRLQPPPLHQSQGP
jgi:hypothetical protein